MADMNKADVETVGKDVKLIMYGSAKDVLTGLEPLMLCTLYKKLVKVGDCKLIVHKAMPDVPDSKPYIEYDPKALYNYPLLGAKFEQIPYTLKSTS